MLKTQACGVAPAVQWVRHPTAVAPGNVETQILSLGQCSVFKYLALPQLWYRSQRQLKFSPWPGNFHMIQVWPQTNK